MIKRPLEDQIKLFGMSNQLLENDLDRIERAHSLDLGRDHRKTVETDQDYYPQLDRDIRKEAQSMSAHYEIFYSLEKSIRRLIADSLAAAEPTGWWQSKRMPPKVKTDAESRMQREIDSGMTPRSEDPIDFTTFGELGEIIKLNPDVFGAIFTSQRAVERVMSNLNALRGPIAHCSPLAEDEVVRLRLTVRDWFRLME
jgi:Swt1-like HEPN